MGTPGGDGDRGGRGRTGPRGRDEDGDGGVRAVVAPGDTETKAAPRLTACCGPGGVPQLGPRFRGRHPGLVPRPLPGGSSVRRCGSDAPGAGPWGLGDPAGGGCGGTGRRSAGPGLCGHRRGSAAAALAHTRAAPHAGTRLLPQPRPLRPPRAPSSRRQTAANGALAFLSRGPASGGPFPAPLQHSPCRPASWCSRARAQPGTGVRDVLSPLLTTWESPLPLLSGCSKAAGRHHHWSSPTAPSAVSPTHLSPP